MLPGLTGIGLYHDGICVTRVVRENGQRPRVVLWDFRPYGPGETPREVLADVTKDHDLQRSRCTTVLDEADYKLLLTEAPDVAREELTAAVRWRIKDLIDFHINDAALDVFELPDADVSVAMRELYAVAARNQAIKERVDLMNTAGVHLDIIDIPEMAQRNIAALMPEDAAGVALVSLSRRNGLLTLTRNGSIYLSRPLVTGLDVLQGEGDRIGYFDQIVLDVQRSLDYFESHFRQAPIRHLMLAPFEAAAPGLDEYLSGNFSIPVSQVNLDQLVEFHEALTPVWQARCLTTIGAALRAGE